MTSPNHLALTAGEPAGIGPDIVIKIAEQDLGCNITVLVDPGLLDQRAQELGHLTRTKATEGCLHFGRFSIASGHTLKSSVTPGKLDVSNAKMVYESIQSAAKGCLMGEFDAMVTAPVHKGIINDAGIKFSGHTELIAAVCGVATPVMMLVNRNLRVALITTHLPLAEVPAAISVERIEAVTAIVDQALRARFGIKTPRIIVCGLNPHAGEGGHLGREEIEIIAPCLTTLRQKGLKINGPLPADTAFTQEMLENTDVVIAMYHDQGLPVIKAQGFGEIVNITLGLPIVRTSVDHGTALALAATGKASEQSLLAAIRQAKIMTGEFE